MNLFGRKDNTYQKLKEQGRVLNVVDKYAEEPKDSSQTAVPVYKGAPPAQFQEMKQQPEELDIPEPPVYMKRVEEPPRLRTQEEDMVSVEDLVSGMELLNQRFLVMNENLILLDNSMRRLEAALEDRKKR